MWLGLHHVVQHVDLWPQGRLHPHEIMNILRFGNSFKRLFFSFLSSRICRSLWARPRWIGASCLRCWVGSSPPSPSEAWTLNSWACWDTNCWVSSEYWLWRTARHSALSRLWAMIQYRFCFNPTGPKASKDPEAQIPWNKFCKVRTVKSHTLVYVVYIIQVNTYVLFLVNNHCFCREAVKRTSPSGCGSRESWTWSRDISWACGMMGKAGTIILM